MTKAFFGPAEPFRGKGFFVNALWPKTKKLAFIHVPARMVLLKVLTIKFLPYLFLAQLVRLRAFLTEADHLDVHLRSKAR